MRKAVIVLEKNEWSEPKWFFHHTRTERPDSGSFERHCHDRYELLYVEEGEGRYAVEGVEYPLRANTAILLPPYSYHYVRPEEQVPYERFVIHFQPDLLDPALRASPVLGQGTNGAVYFPAETLGNDFAATLRLLSATLQAGGGGKDGPEAVMRGTLSLLLGRLCAVKPAPPTQDPDNRAAQMIAYLNDHLTERLTLDDMARRFYINKFYLCRLFREETGMTVFAYLHTKRIAMAEQLLQTGIPAAEVAERVGFSDYSTFWRAYRKQTGRPPVRPMPD